MATLQEEAKIDMSSKPPGFEENNRLSPNQKDGSSSHDQDGGYRWVCVVCQLLITACTWGVNGVSPTRAV